MPQFSTRHRVSHSATNMFELVADVERYPEFLPLCEAMTVRSRVKEGGHETITATMTVAYKMLRESFTSQIVLAREKQEIRVSYIDGPFKHLENVWSFQPAGEEACEIGFSISYEFRSRLLQTLMGAAFDKAFHKFADAFEKRADQIYGRRGKRAGSEPREAALKTSPPA